MKTKFIAALLILSAVSGRCFGKEMDYYIEISLINAGAKVGLNGFPMFDKEAGSRSRSKWVTPYLISGVNTISVSYDRTGKSDDNSGLTCAVVSVPHGSARGSNLESNVVECVLGSQVSWITQFTTNELEVLYGKLLPHGAGITFETQANSVRRWSGIVSGHNQFKILPSRLDYAGLNMNFTNVSIRFSKTNTDVQVVFGGFDMTNSIGSVDLTSERITDGAEWIDEKGFNSLTIQGHSQRGIKTKIASMKIVEVDDNVSSVNTFVLTMPQQWTWEKGDLISSVSTHDKALIWDKVESVHHAFASNDWNALTRLFSNKITDVSGALYASVEAMESEQASFFANLVLDADWRGLKPLPVDGFKCVIICDKVVKVERLSGANLIVSESMTNATNPDRTFELPLFFSRISGEWQITQ